MLQVLLKDHDFNYSNCELDILFSLQCKSGHTVLISTIFSSIIIEPMPFNHLHIYAFSYNTKIENKPNLKSKVEIN
jgi:hypothetical protein